MAGLQRSVVSFRRQGSSGIVWDDRFISEELNQSAGADTKPKEEGQEGSVLQLDLSRHGGKEAPSRDQDGGPNPAAATTADRPPPIDLERSRSTGGGRGAYRTGRVSPAVEPPSPKLSACGFCSPFGQQKKQPKKNSGNKRAKKKQGKRRSR